MSLENGISCPVCGLGTVHRQYRHEEFEYKGHKKVIENYPVIVCSDCGEEFVSAQDAKPFEKDLTDFQREVDGLLKPNEIRTIRESLGYNQTEFARVMKVGVKNFARYETGLSPHSRYLDWLLRVLREHPETIHVIDPKRGRTKDYLFFSTKMHKNVRVRFSHGSSISWSRKETIELAELEHSFFSNHEIGYLQ